MKRELEFCALIHLIAAFATVTPLDVCPRNPSLERNATENDSDHLSYRLPKDVVPTKYSVHLEKNERNFTYLGSVSILLKVLEPTSTIVVHSDGLRIVGEQVNLHESKSPSILENILCQFHDRERQFYIVRTERELEPSEYTLTIKFEGEIRDDVFGFYRSFYKENGRAKYALILQRCKMLVCSHSLLTREFFKGVVKNENVFQVDGGYSIFTDLRTSSVPVHGRATFEGGFPIDI